MGRIKTTWIKNISKELIKKYPDKFTDNFEQNSKFLSELNLFTSKKIKNKVCGYIKKLKSKSI
ncbi:MAG: 30S ribosomal protein S17e [Candidatus Aenigmatarchaeota archaeon]|nr:30S ribosomal protein S17e [Candidatus Aenigmarchaeota archaeon]